MKVLYGEGYAHHTGPEPCGVDREVGGEASAGGGVGQPLSRERQVIPGADDVPASEGNTNRREPSAGTVWPGVVLDPGMRSSSLRGNREVSCPSGARMRRRIASGRRGAVADDERAGEVNSAIVAGKPTNGAGQPAEESVEPRAGAEEKVSHQSTRRAQYWRCVSQAMERLRQPHGAQVGVASRRHYIRGRSRMRETRTYGCVSSESWHVQQEIDLPGQKSGAP